MSHRAADIYRSVLIIGEFLHLIVKWDLKPGFIVLILTYFFVLIDTSAALLHHSAGIWGGGVVT